MDREMDSKRRPDPTSTSSIGISAPGAATAASMISASQSNTAPASTTFTSTEPLSTQLASPHHPPHTNSQSLALSSNLPPPSPSGPLARYPAVSGPTPLGPAQPYTNDINSNHIGARPPSSSNNNNISHSASSASSHPTGAAPSYPASGPGIDPQHHLHPDHRHPQAGLHQPLPPTPTSASHQFHPPPTLPPFPPQHPNHPPVQSASAPPFGQTGPSHGDGRPGYGPPLTLDQPRHYSQEQHSSTRPPSAAGQPGLADRQQSAPAGSIAPHPPVPPAMDHQAAPPPPPPHHSAYAHPSHMDGSVNGTAAPHHPPNGMPPYSMPPGGEQYAAPHPGYHTQHAPMNPNYPQQSPYTGPTSFSIQNRPQGKKHSRAQQACNNCRARKQKCDEHRPCSYCKQEKMNCEYKDVPAPKADKNLQAILDAIRESQSHSSEHKAELRQMREMIQRQQHLIEQIMKDRNDNEANVTNDVAPSEALGSHSTGAHYLIGWDIINEFYKSSGVENASYVYELLETQGVPRLLFRGSTGDDPQGNGRKRVRNHGRDTDIDDFYPADFGPYSAEKYNLGGLNPNGSLRVDEATVKRLYDSFMKKIYIIYPIFDVEALKAKVEKFCRKYSPMDTGPQYSMASPSTHGLKRSHSQMEDYPEQPPDPGHSAGPRVPIAHSLDNAIILLVLALGKLSDHDQYLIPEDLRNVPPPFGAEPPSHGSSPNYAKASPTQSNGGYANHSSPKFPGPHDMLHQSHRSSSTGPYGNYEQPDRNDHYNVARIPGLAYYHKASVILAECVGRRTLDVIQAYILGGLFWGQIGYILPSAEWINRAANLVVECQNKFTPAQLTQIHIKGKEGLANDELDLFLLLFWSVQQLEGDITAELDRLPKSFLKTNYKFPNPETGAVEEMDVKFPPRLLGVPGSQIELFYSTMDSDMTLMHFTSQLFLRLQLNKAHGDLYGTEPKNIESRKKGIEHLAAVLWDSLQEWRVTYLADGLKWSDEEPLSTDILHARLRAKYYGAAYIISRVYLQKALQTGDRIELDSTLSRQSLAELEAEGTMEEQNPFQRTRRGIRSCILSALHSTIAFDGTSENMSRRPLLPNIFGTASAQFSNMLVLAAAFLAPQLQNIVPAALFISQLRRTIMFLHNLSPVSPVFRKNNQILMQVYHRVQAEMQKQGIKDTGDPMAIDYRPTAAGWAGSPTNRQGYGSPQGGNSDRLSTSSGTPRNYSHDITSASGSFGPR